MTNDTVPILSDALRPGWNAGFRYQLMAVNWASALREVAAEDRLPFAQRRTVLKAMLALLPDGRRDDTVDELVSAGHRVCQLEQADARPWLIDGCREALNQMADAAVAELIGHAERTIAAFRAAQSGGA